ncbi:MAG: hypothetical protein COY40_02135 [Alphaproteobacteria bacterium CG_4_10_14_0_8_um_filter_53_9]|nr:MAG: hypothetical protein COY40_02135 [Alphaproteobacteria bacterium CG_4_10_14_0_8_um_filter_53_9]
MLAYELKLVRHAARQPQTAMLWLFAALWVVGTPLSVSLALVPCIVIFPLLGVIDARTQLLPDVLTLSLLATGLLLGPIASGSTYLGSILGAIAGGGIFAALLLAYTKITKRDGMGWGDVKLLAALGAWVGLLGLLPLLLAASLTALLYNYVTRTPKHARIPFGPFLLLGGWVTLFYQSFFWRFILPH